jgi:hypothetical protein
MNSTAPHRWGPYRWGGLSTCLCTQCKNLFTSVAGFDRHYTSNLKTGEMICSDPRTVKRADGLPVFVQVLKPGWNPPYVWSKYNPKPNPWRENDAA